MGSFAFSLSKGLREPCSPFRSAYVFGAELNAPNADGWNCIPEIVDPTTTFDLAAISPMREVVVALLVLRNASAGTYTFKWSWYREADEALLYNFVWSAAAAAGQWVYTYSYIGRVPWEIDRNGRYHVNIDVTGPEGYFDSRGFDVVGMPVVAPEPVPVPGATNVIVTAFNQFTSFLYDIYLQVLEWPWPFWLVSSPFYWLSVFSADLARAFSDFAGWVSEVSAKISGILSWGNLQALIRSWLPGLEELISWWSSWWANVTGTIESWWTVTGDTVRGWIAAAGAELREWVSSSISNIVTQLSTIVTSLELLAGSVQGFFAYRLPQLIDITTLTDWWEGRIFDIQGLIDSSWSLREGLWQGWSDFRDKVAEFFEDPEAWLLEKIESMIVRFW